MVDLQEACTALPRRGATHRPAYKIRNNVGTGRASFLFLNQLTDTISSTFRNNKFQVLIFFSISYNNAGNTFFMRVENRYKKQVYNQFINQLNNVRLLSEQPTADHVPQCSPSHARAQNVLYKDKNGRPFQNGFWPRREGVDGEHPEAVSHCAQGNSDLIGEFHFC